MTQVAEGFQGENKRMTEVLEGFQGENKRMTEGELGSLRLAFRSHFPKNTVCLWNSPDDAVHLVDFNCKISCDSILVVVEVRNDYYRVLTENCNIGWIHKRNTQSL